MCGIVGYIGDKNAGEVLLKGLKRLEYRGYDSSGLAVISDGGIKLVRSKGKLAALEEKLKGESLSSSMGIGHTRWATHGRPSDENAHPHVEGRVAVVHNGIIENYLEIREELKNKGALFKSETDTEIFAHLIDRALNDFDNLEDAVRSALGRVKGSYALAVLSTTEPGKIVGAREECPFVIGVGGEGETFLASDVLAVLDETDRVVFMEDGEIVTITAEGYEIRDANGGVVEREERVIDWSPGMAEKDGFPHFMLKEIFEQPNAIIDTMRGVVMEEEGDVFLNDFDIELDAVKRLYITACGTSWHSALVGKFMIEDFSGLPVEVDLASEFRYRNPLVGPDTLVIAISQSGETADTLAAVREVRKKGAKVLSICNVVESSITRESDYTFMTHAGPEIGVASTKAFTSQLAALYLIAVYLGRRTGKIEKERGVELIRDLLALPGKIEEALKSDEVIKKVAKKYFEARDFLYLGRSINYPIALEGALKLKEISYIHAEGYPAGEMKHGPIALIDEKLPVVVVAPNDKSYVKVLSNVEEVKARGGKVIAIVSEGDEEASARADDVIVVPDVPTHLSPIVTTIPLQLLAYHIAAFKETDIDQPRNLAKSVTVE